MCLRPALLPDEFALGYQGRVMRLNGWVLAKDAMAHMAKWAVASGQAESSCAPVEYLAYVAGIPIAEFVRHHTLFPYVRAFGVTPDPSASKPGWSQDREVLRMTALRVERPGCFFCARCVREDLSFHGMSYWRRAHQLPGTVWCEKHGCALCYSASHDAFLRSPAEVAGACTEIDKAWVRELQGNHRIHQFHAIASALVDGRAPRDERAVSRLLRQRASAAGWHTGLGAMRRPHIVSLLLQQFDARWIAEVVPDIHLDHHVVGGAATSVGRALLGKRLWVNVAVYVALLAVLFDTADDAVQALDATDRADQLQVKRYEAEATDPRILRSAYASTRGDLRAAADMLGQDRDRVRRRLLAMGLPGLGSSRQGPRNLAVEAFLFSGLSVAEASQQAGIDAQALEQLLRQAATPFLLALKEMGRGPGTVRRRRVKHGAMAPPGYERKQGGNGRAMCGDRVRPCASDMDSRVHMPEDSVPQVRNVWPSATEAPTDQARL